MKLLFELGPIIAFFATYKLSNFILATTIMISVTLFCLATSYFLDKKLSLPLLISGAILIFLGITTIYSSDPKYMKMKPTIVYLIFGTSLLIDSYKKKHYLKNVLGKSLPLKEEAWGTLAFRFSCYFFGMAILNEIVWRTQTENFWVNFKVFGMTPITLLFIATQIPFIRSNYIETK